MNHKHTYICERLRYVPTFDTFIRRGTVPTPRRISVPREVTQFEVRDGETNDGGLVELRGDGCRKGQHLG